MYEGSDNQTNRKLKRLLWFSLEEYCKDSGRFIYFINQSVRYAM